MPHYYLGPWTWRTSPRPSWGPPPGCVHALDLRPLPAQSLVGGPPQGSGLFVLSERLADESGYDYLGNDLNRTLSGPQRNAWRSRLGLIATPAQTELSRVLFETLTILADPTGDDVCPPLLPGADGAMELGLAGIRRRIAPRSSEFANSRERLRRDYRRIREESLGGLLPANQHRKYLATLLRSFGLPPSDSRVFTPDDLPDEGPLTPATTLTESFDKADSSTLGPDQTWTELANALEVVSNTAANTTAGTVDCVARAEANLSSDNAYCELDVVQLSSAADVSLAAPVCRFSASALTGYICYLVFEVGTDYTALYKLVAGTYTLLGSTVEVDMSLPDTIRVRADGSAIGGFFNGTQNHNETDTSITGHLRGGIDLAGANATDVRVDNWVLSDLEGFLFRPAWDRRTVLVGGGLHVL